MSRSLRCLLGRHRWKWVKAEDGHRYRSCDRCGRDETVVDHGDHRILPGID